MTSKGSARRAAVRFGRPPKGLAGEVEERILDAARKVFLERGFEGASIEEIAEAARSGKPTIYARFPGKEALFTAVVMQNVAANIAAHRGLVRRPVRRSRNVLKAWAPPSCNGSWSAMRSV